MTGKEGKQVQLMEAEEQCLRRPMFLEWGSGTDGQAFEEDFGCV